MEDPGAPVFIGRERELRRLADVQQQTRTGGPVTVILAGEAGVGKSRLVSAFARRAAAGGTRVLAGSCLELGERGVPYAPFVEILRTLVRSIHATQLPALLGPGRPELSRLLPELDNRPRTTEPLDESARQAQPRLFELFLGLVERLAAEAPLVLVIEDLHWADEATRDLLTFLARVLRRGDVMFLVTARTDEVSTGHPTLAHRAGLERLDRVERLDLHPFNRAEVAAQIRAVAGQAPTEEQVSAIAARTNGNPFYVEQIVVAHAESLGREMPPLLRDVLRARVEQLSSGAQDVLRAASAAGPIVDDELLGEVLEQPPRELHVALREVVARQVLVPARGVGQEGRYEFRHALLREVVYAELFSGERVRLHAAYGRALALRAEESPVGSLAVPTPAELAYHWDAARDPARALPAVVDAGAAAERVYAFAEARRHYERALELWDRVADAERLAGSDRAALLSRCADAAVLAGEYGRAVEFGRDALAALDDAVDPARRAFLHERLRWYLFEAGDLAGAQAALDEAERLIPEQPPSGARAVILAHRAGIDMFAGRLARSMAVAREAVAVARAAGTEPQEAMATGILGWDLAMLGDIDAGIAIFRGGLAIAEEAGGVEGIALGYSSLAALLERVGRPEEAVEVARVGYERAVRMGVARTYGGVLLASQASASLVLGCWHDARRLTDEGLERLPTGRTAIVLQVVRARLDVGQGRSAEAAEHLGAARVGAAAHARAEDALGIMVASAELAAATGELSACREAVDAGLAAASDGPPEPLLCWLAAVGLRAEADAAERARARHDAAQTDAATARGEAVAARIRELTRARDAARQVAPEVGTRLDALDALLAAELARLQGDPAPDTWSEAARRYEALARPYPAAYARYREGAAVLASRGSRRDAEVALRAAHAVAVSLDAVPLRTEVELLARQARLDLEAARTAGEPPNEGPASPLAPLGLTDRELEVLRLVAGGWTNQQIADHLFISPKTASVHVSNILGKLGVDSRVEAAAIVHRLGGPIADVPPDAER